MSPGDEKAMSCVRARFSIRKLAIVVTLVCVYFGAWEATKRYGVNSLQEEEEIVAIETGSPAPLIVYRVEIETGGVRRGSIGFTGLPKRYYLWLFGPTIKLPIETTITEIPDPGYTFIGYPPSNAPDWTK